MKAIEVNAVITGVRSKVDGSLGVSLGTPELTPEEKAEFMRLQGMNLIALFTPLDEPQVPKLVIDSDIEQKTPSQRLRNTLFVLWKQGGEKEDFEIFYKNWVEKFIDKIKEKLV
jgi:hypothetical protein